MALLKIKIKNIIRKILIMKNPSEEEADPSQTTSELAIDFDVSDNF